MSYGLASACEPGITEGLFDTGHWMITPDVLQCLQSFLIRASAADRCCALHPLTTLKQRNQDIHERWHCLGVDTLEPEGNPSELHLLESASAGKCK